MLLASLQTYIWAYSDSTDYYPTSHHIKMFILLPDELVFEITNRCGFTSWLALRQCCWHLCKLISGLIQTLRIRQADSAKISRFLSHIPSICLKVSPSCEMDLQTLANALPDLRTLTLKREKLDAGLDQLGCCSNLTKLCLKASAQNFGEILTRLPHLRALRLACRESKPNLTAVSICTSLHKLALLGEFQQEQLAAILPLLPNLRTLECNEISDHLLSLCPSVTCLSVFQQAHGAFTVPTRLQKLRISGSDADMVQFESQPYTAMQQFWIVSVVNHLQCALPPMPNLRDLLYYEDSQPIEWLLQLTALQKLDGSFLWSNAERVFTTLTALQELKLACPDEHAVHSQNLRFLSSLQVLELSSLVIADYSHHPNLKTCYLHVVDWNTEGAIHMENLHHCRSLRNLMVSQGRTVDAKTLMQLSDLRFLRFDGTLPEDVHMALPHLQCLTEFAVVDFSTPTEVLEALAMCKSLLILNIDRYAGHQSAICALALGCPFLRKVCVASCEQDYEEGVIALSENCRQLRQLKFPLHGLSEAASWRITQRKTAFRAM
eukprot:TRINITY_DN11684_c0_g1_i1.p1 TRINITY_DN11684_c0_g1~~TRINITY_DN11684_c0_g1_i1.p1  ORF type:complete len:549 (-),score=53.06 TRINITY_DN11684_c0_g1_i1:7-1653(-)